MKQEELKTLEVNCNDEYLINRYLACYMMYDYSLRHALRCYDNNLGGWIDKAVENVEKKLTEDMSMEDAQNLLNRCYLEILAEEIEDWIQCHIKLGSRTRAEVEISIMEIINELNKKEEE